MKVQIRKDGNYEMFQTIKGHSVICLDNQEWYAKIKNYLVRSDPSQQKTKELISGKYLLVESRDGINNEILHLFLLKKNDFEELILQLESNN